MQGLVETWYHRNITLMGKVVVINSLFMSLFVYKLSVLPPMTDVQVERIWGFVQKFLWKGKRAKIPTKVLELDKKNGGLRLTNIRFRAKCFRLKWIIMLKTNPEVFSYVYEWLLPCIGELIWDCNAKYKDVSTLCHQKSYWNFALEDWCEIHFFQPQDDIEVKNQIIWYNSHIKIRGKILTIGDSNSKAIFNAGILKIEDLLDDSNFLSCRQIERKYGIKIHPCKHSKQSNLNNIVTYSFFKLCA